MLQRVVVLLARNVAATKSLVIFIGTGEHLNDFEVFNVKPFNLWAGRLLGKCDWSAFVDKFKDLVPGDEQQLEQNILNDKFTLASMYRLFQQETVQQLAPMLQEISGKSLPEGCGKLGQEKIKSYLTIMDSMTKKGKRKRKPS
ncbi:hypothetical protein Tsubulata_037548 [Turnera subulata]|uniref:Uncharacterized protein n=1 Tax=Turnera subulata TaxID=218843 RepID=A0A9Q0FH17_9ROSI|nr:hypothetical protein Tsubulata_037548 [Turnera subulata]